MIKQVKPRKNAVKVFCESTNTIFPMLKMAAKEANADAWTMSKKMITDGAYIDDFGRKWVRLTPSNSTKQYTPTGQRLKFHRWKSVSPAKKAKTEPVQALETTPKKQLPEFVKKAVSEKIKAELKQTPVWKDICEIMDYLGVKQLIITKD